MNTRRRRKVKFTDIQEVSIKLKWDYKYRRGACLKEEKRKRCLLTTPTLKPGETSKQRAMNERIKGAFSVPLSAEE